MVRLLALPANRKRILKARQQWGEQGGFDSSLREACAVSQSPQLLTIGAQVCQKAIPRFLASEDEDPAKDDASNVVASLAHALIPCASGASREAAIAAVADIVLAPDAMFSTDASRDARCDLATALVEQLDKATLEPLA